MSARDALSLSNVAERLSVGNAAEALHCLQALLGCSVQLGGCNLAPRGSRRQQSAMVVVDGDDQVIVELGAKLAAWIVDRALGGEASLTRIDAGFGVSDDVSIGALAYVAARVASTWPGHHEVTDVLTSDTEIRALGHEGCPRITVTMNWDGASEPVHVWCVREAKPRSSVRRNERLAGLITRERCVLSAVLDPPITLTASQARALCVDDVVRVPRSSLMQDALGWQGHVRLGVVGARRHAWIGTLAGDRIELQERRTMEHDGLTAGRMQQATDDPLAPIDDVPLELSVEIARFTLPLAEIAGLVAGQVLLTGRDIGEHVKLRVGGQVIATGELVNVDGELGVRLSTIAGA